jgi:hypothetical protein
MKKKGTSKLVVTVPVDAGRKARQEARALVGAPKPARPLEERQAPTRKPKHKKPVQAEDE